ncbi:hypothetical protein ACOMHN_028898 [Nucella lapillus]
MLPDLQGVRIFIGNKPDQVDIADVQQRLRMGFMLAKIARDRNVHRSTLYRRLKAARGSVRSKYVGRSPMEDEELRDKICQYNRDHPYSGAIELQGWLRSQGFVVQRRRCPKSCVA